LYKTNIKVSLRILNVECGFHDDTNALPIHSGEYGKILAVMRQNRQKFNCPCLADNTDRANPVTLSTNQEIKPE
jgi:hypothetical protein